MTKKNKMTFISKLVFFTEENELIKKNLRIADLFYEEGIYLAIIARHTTINILKNKIPREYEDKIILVNRNFQTKDKIKNLKEKGAIFALIGIVEEDAVGALRRRAGHEEHREILVQGLEAFLMGIGNV